MISKEELINKLQTIYFGNGYINKQKHLIESINPTFKKLAARVYKNGIVDIENETNIISKINHPSDIQSIVSPEFGDLRWLESEWITAKSKLGESFPIFILSKIMLSIIYYLVSKTPEKDPVFETIKRFSKNLNKLNLKNKKAVDEAIEAFINFYQGK